MRATTIAATFALVVAACPHHPTRPEAQPDWKAQLAGGLLVASSVARIVANEADTNDGAVGCIVGETVGTTFRAAAREITGATSDTTATLDICACLAMREDWKTVDVSAALVSQMQESVLGVSLIIQPQIKTCEGTAWLDSTTTALVNLISPVASAVALEQCVIPVPKLAPDLTHCPTVE